MHKYKLSIRIRITFTLGQKTTKHTSIFNTATSTSSKLSTSVPCMTNTVCISIACTHNIHNLICMHVFEYTVLCHTYHDAISNLLNIMQTVHQMLFGRCATSF